MSSLVRRSEVYDQIARVAKAMANGKRLELLEWRIDGLPVQSSAGRAGEREPTAFRKVAAGSLPAGDGVC